MARSKPEIALLALGAALFAALLGIGAASNEMIRHVVQAAPVALLTLLAVARPEWSRWLLGPPFAFWLLIAVCIGLFLAGLPSPIDGTFDTGERAFTVALATIGLAGFVQFPRIHRPLPLATGLMLALVALALQVGAMAISLQPAIAHR